MICDQSKNRRHKCRADISTRHLDVDAKDELKRALQEYKGAVLLVCHEPEFYDGLVDEVWNLEEFSTKPSLRSMISFGLSVFTPM